MKQFCILLFAGVFFLSCKTGTGLFGKSSPHSRYAERLRSSGLEESALGRAWFTAADSARLSPLEITIPYKEEGFFAAASPAAAGLRFQAKQGEEISIKISRRPGNAALYLDVWKAEEAMNDKPKTILSADTSELRTVIEVDENQSYILRLQPELLQDVSYTLEIINGPSLAFPVQGAQRRDIGSIWGDDRDGGARRHEGIDIFAKRGTPVLAAASGRVRVSNNRLGGKVIWQRPSGKSYNIYYAHLDSHLVANGDMVHEGDTIALVGNTGNAITTPPHLHLGIYAMGGAVDPLPFVDPEKRVPPAVNEKKSLAGELVRAGSSVDLYRAAAGNAVSKRINSGSLLRVEAAAGGKLRVYDTGSNRYFVDHGRVAAITSPITTRTLSEKTTMYHLPDSSSLKITVIEKGEKIEVLAREGNFDFINSSGRLGWILRGV